MEQVRNTVPFLWDFEGGDPGFDSAHRYVQILRDSNFSGPQKSSKDLTHLEYFQLCISAHFATVASFVPTDVDNQIRFKLWHPSLETRVIEQMLSATLEFYTWDFKPVSTRWVESRSGSLSGHHGEWFSIVVAAYGALRRRVPSLSKEVAGLILKEIERERDVYEDLRRERDGIGVLKAATLIAHNLGDLDRVMEMWGLGEEDFLRQGVSGLVNGVQKSLLQAGLLNKSTMAIENHRHFSLRKPRCLRKSADFLLPIGPFFDEWGARLVRCPDLSPEDLSEVVDALVAGWERLGGETVGYARALSAMLEHFPGGPHALTRYLPASVNRALKAGVLRNLISVPRARFEQQWMKKALSTCLELRKK